MAIEYSERDGIAEIVLADGENGNVLAIEDIKRLEAILREVRASVPLVTVMRQEGRDFCRGRAHDSGGLTRPELFSLLVRCTALWGDLPGLTVAAAHGRCEGFGVGFVAQADISIVGESLTFVFPEIKSGFAPAIVAGWLLHRVPWQVAAPWLLTARPIAAEEARSHGLVGQVVPDGEVAAQLHDALDSLRQLDRRALLECKRYARAIAEVPRPVVHTFAADALVRQFAERE
jgi:enoyl-CoA hydratase/carnithine racemase